nr:hypothetical protein CFP56_35654 [Quercus suber]
MVIPGIDEIGGVFSRSDGCSGKVGAVGGLLVDPNSSGVEVGCMGFSVKVAGGPTEDFLNFGPVLNSDGQPVNVEPSTSPPLLVFEFSDMFHRHQMLGNNCFSPLSELGFDSKDDEIMLLDWVNPMRSSKDEDVGNALECVPLAKWDPQRGMELVSEETELDDFLVGEELEPSVRPGKARRQKSASEALSRGTFSEALTSGA